MTQAYLTSLSHDMKTPLTAIALYNDLLRRMEPNDPERQTCHEIIADQISRLVHITNTVLGGNSSGGNIVNLVSLLKDTVSIYKKLHPDYVFRLYSRADLPAIWGDGPALGRVMTNLLDNAIAYSQPTQIVIAAELQSDGIQIRVRDRGYGIAEKHLPHIFRPHFRGNSTVPGNGMGLAIVQDIVDSHGGRIEVASTVSVGTVIRITFPQHLFLETT